MSKCPDCEHGFGTDLRGRCMAILRDAGGSLVNCGCKCLLSDAPAQPEGEQERSTMQWSKDWPEINGFYWLRGWRHYIDLPIKVDGDEFWMMFNLAANHRGELGDSDGVQFLGPITPKSSSAAAPVGPRCEYCNKAFCDYCDIACCNCGTAKPTTTPPSETAVGGEVELQALRDEVRKKTWNSAIALVEQYAGSCPGHTQLRIFAALEAAKTAIGGTGNEGEACFQGMVLEKQRCAECDQIIEGSHYCFVCLQVLKEKLSQSTTGSK